MRTDKAYEYDINQLIPLAEKEARAKVNFTGLKSTKNPGAADKVTGKCTYYNHCFFTEFFHRAMKRLAIENELRKF